MILRSFYSRLSLLFLLMIVLLGAVSLAIAFNASTHLFDEVEQLLNREYAASIAEELKPLVGDGFSEASIEDAIHYMMVLNPMVEIYLLDARGKILSYFTHPNEKLIRQKIGIEPLSQFIENQGWEPILGDDPRTEKQVKPFSAAPLQMGKNAGYVYVILRGQSFDQSLDRIKNNYYFQSGLSTFLIALTATLFAGFALFFLLTRRLKMLSLGVKAFEQGQFDHRVVISGNDELAVLGRAFNEMAESIEDGISQLHHAEEQRGELIANISHDLRSPLTSIRGYLETIIMKDSFLSDQEKREFIEICLKNVSGFQNLVEELFDLAKLEARQVEPQRLSFSIAELVQDVVLKLKPQSEASQIQINYRPDRGLHPILGDIGMIERVLSNIIENALSITPAGGYIDISIGLTDHFQEVTINDTGPGIEPEYLPHIFDRFYRADKSRNRDNSGTGLGLAIAREIVELHNGQIHAENISGGGASFRVLLPTGQ